MKPLVSILIPAHNAAPWIAEALQSALVQMWSRREIIVVDDGSQDQTVAVARQFAAKDVLVVSQANQGASAARNHAYSLCQGDYIQWLDADDLLGREKVARQMAVAEQVNDPRVLFSAEWAHFYWRPTQAKFRPSPLWQDLAPKEWLRLKMSGGYQMQTAAWLISRQLSELAGPWDVRLKRDNDGEYMSRLMLAAKAIKFVPQARVYYRLSGPQQITFMGHANAKMESLWLSMQLHIQYLLSLEDSAATRDACLKYLQLWSANFYPHRMDIVAEARHRAHALGGDLPPPALTWKYRWLQKLFGWTFVRSLQTNYNLQKLKLLRTWDACLYQWEGKQPF